MLRSAQAVDSDDVGSGILQSAGGVTRDTNLLGTYIYRLGIGGGDFGTAAAVAMFMLALTVVLTAPYVRLMLKAEND